MLVAKNWFVVRLISKNKKMQKPKPQVKNQKIKAANYCIQYGLKVKRIFKLIFSQGSPDFYIAFPDFLSEKFYCGVMTIPKGESRLEKFNAVENAINISRIPVKFSYHESGTVNFKPTSPKKENLPLSYKLSSIQGTPIRELKGEHIFTIQFEGLEKFEDFKPTNKKGEVDCLAKIPDGKIFFKILGFGGFNEEEISNKHRGSYLKVKIRRKNIEKPFWLGIYLLSGSKSIQSQDKKSPFLLSLVGFKRKHISINEELKALYLYAR